MGFWQKLFGGKPKEDNQEQAPAAAEQPSEGMSAPAPEAAEEASGGQGESNKEGMA